MRSPRGFRRVPSRYAVPLVLIASLWPSGASGYVRPGEVVQVDDIPGRPAPRGATATSSVSADGRYVAFDTEAPLLPADTNGRGDIYVRDMRSDRLWLASIGLRGEPARDTIPKGWAWDQHHDHWKTEPLSWDPMISGNGRYVAFTSIADNLVKEDLNVASDIFVFDRVRRTTKLASVNSEGKQANFDKRVGQGNLFPDSWFPSIDHSGRRVAFTSWADNLAKEENFAPDIFVHDFGSGRTEAVTVGSNGKTAARQCLLDTPVGSFPCVGTWPDSASISGNGRYVAFDGDLPTYVEGDTNRTRDVFVRDLKKRKTQRVSVASDGSEVGLQLGIACPASPNECSYLSWNGYSAGRSISHDGRFITFMATAKDLVPRDGTNYDVFVHDRKTGRTERVSVFSDGSEIMPGGAMSDPPSISADGRFVSFGICLCYNPQEGRSNGYATLIHDRRTGATEVASRNSNGKLGSGCRTPGPGDNDEFANSELIDFNRDGSIFTMSSCNASFQRRPDPDTNRFHIFLRNRGDEVGAGGLITRGALRIAGAPTFGELGYAGARDAVGDAGEGSPLAGQDLIGLNVAYREKTHDLFFDVQVRELARLPGPSLASYSVTFEVAGRAFEVRSSTGATGQDKTTLYECSADGECLESAALRGNIGTTGEAVVFSLPLRDIGLEKGGTLENVTAYTTLGATPVTPLDALDSVRLR